MKRKPVDLERASAAFRRAYDENGRGLTLAEMRSELGGGSFSDIGPIVERLKLECDASIDVAAILPEALLAQVTGVLGSAYRELKHNAFHELNAFKERAANRESHEKTEQEQLLKSLDEITRERDEADRLHKELSVAHQALIATEREQHATIAALQAEVRILKDPDTVERTKRLIEGVRKSPSAAKTGGTQAPKARTSSSKAATQKLTRAKSQS